MLTTTPNLARDALEAAPDAMMIVDAAGIVRYANLRMSELFGYDHDEIVGGKVERLMPERFRHRHLGHRGEYSVDPRRRPMGVGLELFGRRQDSTEFPIEISLSPIRDGDRILIAAAIRDVTERKRVEAELVDARAIAEQAREAAVGANLAKGRFLAMASHDLRQPLQTLALLNGTLRRMARESDALAALSQQEQAIGAMSHLLNALLDINKLESGNIQSLPTDFTVAGLFADLNQDYSALAAAKGLQLQIEASPHIAYSDRTLVEQALRNLVSNAIKYTQQGVVRVRCVNDGSRIRVEVVDTGIGISAGNIPHIFDEFYQAGVPTHIQRNGYGLGLNIVKRIADLLNIPIDVRSEVGKGSVFSLSLPTGAEHICGIDMQSDDASALPPPPSQQQHVLLVEDDPSVRTATRMLLKLEGYRVTAVSSIAEALENAKSKDIDLLITDYHLGGSEVGTALITTLRRRLGSALRTVLITGDTLLAIKDLPTDPYLRIASKPINADTLLMLLRTFPAT